MLIAVYIILILIGVFAKLKLKHCDLMIIAFLFLITYLGINRADYENYEQVYNWIGAGNFYLDTGYGWYYLCLLGNKLNITYQLFSALILLGALLLIRHTVNYYIDDNREAAIVWSLYLLYPALLDCIQTRFLLAQALVVFALPRLTERNLKNFLTYTITVVLAFFVHSSCIIYLLFLLVYFFERVKKALIVIVALATAIVLFAREQLISLAVLMFNNARIERYLYSIDSVGTYGLVAYIATLILMYVIAKKCQRISKGSEDVVLVQFADLFYQISILSCILLPLSTFDTNIFRLQRLVWLMMYTVFGLLRKDGILVIKFNRLGFRIRALEMMTALAGFAFYISVFNFDVIQSLLL